MPTRILLAIKFLLLSSLLHAQISPKSSLRDSSLFRSKIKGHVKQLLQWRDKLGLNYLVLTETPEFTSSAKTSSWDQDCTEEGCTDKELYAYHFLNTDSLLWKITDFERACSVDIFVEFRKNATRVTDLDSNGVAETWIMYSLTCTSDVSPRKLKLIMHQGSKKYSIRGTSQPAKQMLDGAFGGKYFPDASFSSLPARWKNYAKKLWAQNIYDLP